jgi:uncharacterized protein YbjT (DUF2867 family)
MDGRDGAARGKAVTGRVFIAGGTGFVGSNLLAALGDRPVRLLVRSGERPQRAGANVEVVKGDVTDAATLRSTLDGCEAVINLVAIIKEQGKATFDGVIRGGTENLVNEASRAGVPRFVLMSAMGAMDDARYPYMQAKWRAEQLVKQSGMGWTIFRPSVIFGPGDEFINTLAKLVRMAPVIPVVGDGKSKFQPVSVKEVAQAFVTALDDPKAIGNTYELGGPDILEYEQMLDIIAQKLGKRKPKAHVPVGLMKPVVKLSKPLPAALRPPVTEEQLKMLALDNCTNQSATSKLIGRQPLRLKDGIDYIVSR